MDRHIEAAWAEKRREQIRDALALFVTNLALKTPYADALAQYATALEGIRGITKAERDAALKEAAQIAA